MTAPARKICSLAACLFGSALLASAQPVVINEILFHPLQPQFGAEPLGEEFIELFNKSSTNVHLSGWRFNKGMSFTFPNVTLPAGGYLVVSPDTNTFLRHYGPIPGAILVGNWDGTLGNNGETIELKDAADNVIDSVPYATEGDWALRQRGPSDIGHRGWKWYCEADGLGKSMERRNPNLPGDSGQNWRFSATANGTPGRPNAAQTNNIAPFLFNLAHSPVVPRSTQSVSITVRILDESVFGLVVTLFYSINPTTSPATFTSVPMFDDGLHGDGVMGDGIYGATMAAQANGSIVEFYVQASDAGGRTRTWPGPAIAAADSTGPTGQVANALYQVDNDPQNDFGVLTSSQPLLKLIMTAAENTELAGIPGSAGNTDAEMNGTFIALDGISTEVRYRCGFRNRGHGSRSANPPNYRVNIPNEQLWKRQAALNVNSVNTPAQVLGATLAKKAGLAGADSRAAQVRVNNLNRSRPGTDMLGSYALNEELNTEWAAQHFPMDSAGNVYRAIRDIAPSEWAYRGPLVSSYINTYFKTDNSSAYDWSDLIQVHRIVGAADLFTTANVRQVANVEQWCLYYAVMALEGNSETSPNTGYNDDYFMYRGVNDPRFLLMYYDNDSILSSAFGANGTSTSLFNAEAGNGMGAMTTRFLEWPDFKPIYYATLHRLINTTYSQPEFDAMVDEVMNTYPSGPNRESVRSSVKSYMAARRAYVQGPAASGGITGSVPPATNNPIATVSGEPRTPTPFATATLAVGGPGITHYKWKLNNDAYSGETPVATTISFSGLANGSTNTVSVVGRNAAGIYQDTTHSTVSKSWVVNTLTPNVRLNEVLARNDSAVPHNGTFPDLIELYNEGATTVDLSGLQLTDDGAAPGKYAFPAGTTLAGGAYLVLYANNVDGTPGIHLGFSLNQDGDSVYLLDRATNGNVLLDSVTFGVQLPDKSIGRFASGDWLLCQPSFGGINVAQATGNAATLKITEWLAASGALPFVDDFIEIYNPDPLPVAMGGMHLTDEPIGAPALHRIADLSFVAGGGFISFTADGNDTAGANHLGFQLDADIGEIGLIDARFNKIDCVSYGPQRAGVSMGRCPDGSVTNITFLSFPTPRVANACSTPPPAAGVVVNEVFARNTTVAEPDGSTPDWVEIYNPSQAAVDLGDASLSDSTLDSRRWVFPSPTILPSQGYLAVRFDSGAPASATNTGFSLKGSGDSVYLFNKPADGGGVLDHVDFGIQAEDFSIGRVPNGSANWQLTIPSARAANIAAPTNDASGLKVNEWMAQPEPGKDDWFEIYNGSPQPVNLGGLWLSDNLASASSRQGFRLQTLSFIGSASNAYQRFWADNNLTAGADHVNFKLAGTGEAIGVSTADGTLINGYNFGPQDTGVSEGRFPDGSTHIVRFRGTATPGRRNLVPLQDIVINEVLTHTDPPLEDAVELANFSSRDTPIGGWFLSDSDSNLKKYRIAAGTAIPAGGFRVFTQSQFGTNTDPGALAPFTFDGAHGGAVYLSAADEAGNLTGYHSQFAFGAAANGVSFGRIVTSLGADQTAASARSLGSKNPPPLVGPVVINELMYHPVTGGIENEAEEFIELHNTTLSSVPLYDPANPANTWRLGGGVQFTFPTGVLIPSRGYLLVVNFDPASNSVALANFRAKYSLPVRVPIHGPYGGKLDNDGEGVELYKPDPPQTAPPDAGFVPQVLVDRVVYSAAAPWPPEPAGTGSSLQRRRPYSYGNELANWKGEPPTAGRANVPGSTYTDTDGDGLPDDWENAHALAANNPADADADADADGHSNYEEYLDGTNPQSAVSYLEAPSLTAQPQNQEVLPGSNATFSVTATGTLPLRYQWSLNSVLIADATNSSFSVPNAQPSSLGTYSALVLNGAGFALSQGASLVIHQPPVITVQPSSQTVLPGTTVVFVVAATGTGTINYQWLFNGAPIPGETNATFTTSNVGLGSEGDYAALVTDAFATVSSQTARLIVRIAPIILIPPVGQTNPVGAAATFTVRCSGSVPMTFIWRRGSTPVLTNVLYITNAFLSITNLQLSDSNTYRLIVTNSGSFSISGTNVTFINAVWPAVAILSQPTNVAANAGGAASFSLIATSLNLTYQWRRNGVNLPDATNATLNLTNLQPSQAGGYSALVTNIVGSAVSQTATLSLPGVPVLTEPEYLPGGMMRFKLLGISNQAYFIEVSSNFVDWPTLTNLLATNALMPFLDGTSPSVTHRFYRARVAP